jgi:AcrR family transcriptional regulator
MDETRAAQSAPARRGGRPPLTESRKAQIRLDIAMAAVRLFTEHGLDGTSVAQIAEAVGISTRTLWRYFPRKEDCAAPLLSLGLDRFTWYVQDWPTDRPLVEAADHTDWFTDTSTPRLLLVLDLLRLTCTEPALDAVWIRCYSDAVGPLAAALAERLGHRPGDLEAKVKASMLLASMHQAMRHHLNRAPGEHGPSLEDTIRIAARIGFAAVEAGAERPAHVG